MEAVKLNKKTQRNPDMRMVGLYVPTATKEQFKAVAKERGISLSQLLREQINKILEN